MSEQSPLPPRREQFASPVARAVWAAIVSLETSLRHEILLALQQLLCVPARIDTHGTRVSHAVTCLRQVAELLGGSPSVGDYRQARADHPEFDLPADSLVRRWLGGSWNDCLKQARLDPVRDGDVLVSELGPSITGDEIIAALCECASDLATIPTFHRYLNWARRPDVKARPGRRPQSQSPFDRTFGGFVESLKAAGLLAGESLEQLPRSTRVRLGGYFIDDEVIRDGLREVANRLGHSPRVREYNLERERIILESGSGGELRSIPSHSLIQRRYGTWDAALIDAGLEELGGRVTRSVEGTRGRRKGPQVSDELIFASITLAYEALGGPFTSVAYRRWRKEQKARDLEARIFRRIPDYHTIWKRFGTWENALKATFEVQGGEQTEGVDEAA
jgi:hypothetical protein